MKKNNWKKRRLSKLTTELEKTYTREHGINNIEGVVLPTQEAVHRIIQGLLELIFPGYISTEPVKGSSLSYYLGYTLDYVFEILVRESEKALHYKCEFTKHPQGCRCDWMAEKIVGRVLDRLPKIRELLKQDIDAALAGDPAATCVDEIILSYPATAVIAVHRVAHRLYRERIPLIPRMMSEWAHRKTGIDIHPGAAIGQSFFIDHGTGVVIGETTTIGHHVKLYQGVTLGALSFPRDKRGGIVKGLQRHPTIEDNVTVYANATILGGETVIGKNSVVAANTFITTSIPANSIATEKKSELTIRQKKN